MSIRAKFQIQSVTATRYSDEVIATPVTDDGIPEHQRFHELTPGGELRLVVTNPDLRGRIKPGMSYYVDLTPVDTEG